MNIYEHLRRTEKSWNKMHSTFLDEWQDGFDVMKKQNSYGPAILQTIDYYSSHAARMNRERWPWLKEEEA